MIRFGMPEKTVPSGVPDKIIVRSGSIPSVDRKFDLLTKMQPSRCFSIPSLLEKLFDIPDCKGHVCVVGAALR